MLTTDQLEERRAQRRLRLSSKNRINQLGIELEGGWDKMPKGMAKWCGRTDITRDNSVVFEPPPVVTDPVTGARSFATPMPVVTGEIPSRPLAMTEWHDFMHACYPHHVNATCGMHVHMSFTTKLNYQRLMDPAYMTHILKALYEWATKENLPSTHPLWDRLGNANHNHCAHIYLGDAQVKVDHKDFRSRGTAYSRYTAINYCYAQHRTVEVRVLPMMDEVEQAIRAIQTVIDATNGFLAKIKTRECRVPAMVSSQSPELSVHEAFV